VLLQGTGNSWSGGTVISGGTIGITDDAQLSTAPVTINSGTLELVAGNTASSTRTLTLAGAASSSGLSAGAGSTYTLSGALVGTEGFRKLGAGTIVIGADNAGLSGTVVLGTAGANQASAGTLRLTTNSGLGSAAISMPGTNVSQVGLELTNNITVSNNITTASREAFGGGPAIPMLRNVSDNNTYSGTITVNATGGAVGFESQAGTLGVTGPIVNSVSERGLWLTGAGDGVVNTALNNGSGFRVIKDGAGTWTLGSAATNYAGSTTANAGSLVIDNNLTTTASVTVANGATIRMAQNGGRTLGTTSVDVQAGGKLDMTDNDMIVNYTSTSPEFTLRDKVLLARDGDAEGIFFTGSDDDLSDKILAFGEAAELGFTEFNGITVDDTSILGKYTYYGDANFDGAVTTDDYVAVDLGLGTGDSWVQGDFDLNGIVTTDDYVVVDLNLGKGSGDPLAYAEEQAAMIALHTEMFGQSYVEKLAYAQEHGWVAASVPEPGALSLVGLGAMAMLGRRRRRA
jgi:autotransporter-associated beta strand protein